MIFSRYIIKELIPPFILSLLLIVLIFVLNLLFQMLGKIAGRGLDFGVILEFFFLNLAWIITLAVPMAVLIAVMMAYGRLSSDNEVTALQASGVSIYAMLRPVIGFGLIISVVLFYFNDQILPEFNHRSRVLSADISRKKPTLNLIEGVFTFDVPDIVLRAAAIDQETSKLKDVVIYDESDKDYHTTVLAHEGELEFSYEHSQFLLTLYNGTIHRMERLNPGKYQKTEFKVTRFRMDAPNMMLERRESGYRSDREQSSGQMMVMVRKMRAEPKPNLRRINMFMVEIHKKYSIPAACLVFSIVAVPIGIMFRSGGLGVSGGLAIVFFLIYWMCLIGGEDLADRSFVSPWLSMWFPNILILTLGVFLIIRNVKGHSLLDLAVLKKFIPKKIRGRDRYPGEKVSENNNA